jgi:hypothetical protein
MAQTHRYTYIHIYIYIRLFAPHFENKALNWRLGEKRENLTADKP